MDNEIAMLTTIDNPYDPFTQFDNWYAWDFQAGYHTPGALARVAVVTDDMSESDQLRANNEAVDEMVRENYNGMYTKVTRKLSS